MRKLGWALAAGLVVAGPPVGAQMGTGNEALEDCTGIDSAGCGWFIAGYVSGMTKAFEISPPNGGAGEPFELCLPEVQVGQLQDVFIKYLEDHPERRHLSYADLVMESFVEAFPCPAP